MLLPVLASGQSAQESGTQGDLLHMLTSEEGNDRVKLELDSLLVANYYKLLAENREITGIPGYRIRIYSESGLGAREEQQRIRAKFLSYYAGVDAYNRYDEPFFKVYVGDCRTESEALKLRDLIADDFPNPIIVPDYINESGPE
jgi:hypothetical protein